MKNGILLAISFFICLGCSENSKIEVNNETLNTIFQRKSVRQFTQKPVENEKIELLIRAGMSAPSSKDRRPWEFIVVTDRDLLNKMGEKLPFARMLKDVKQAIIVCGDSIRSDNAWYLDCSAASQNILLAAESMDLGAVWTAVYPYSDRIETVRTALELPENIIPLNVIPVGYPIGTETAKNKYDKTRIHYNGW